MAGSQKMMRGRIGAQVRLGMGSHIFYTVIAGVYNIRTAGRSGGSNKAESLGEAISTSAGREYFGCSPGRCQVILVQIRSNLIDFNTFSEILCSIILGIGIKPALHHNSCENFFLGTRMIVGCSSE